MPSKKHTLLLGLCLPLLAAALLTGSEIVGIPQAHAAQGVVLINSLQENIAYFMALIITGLNFLAWVLFVMLNFLLDPVFIFDIKPDGTSELLDMLHNIWVLSRDLMNVVFALGLIVAAIYTVVTAKKEFIANHMSQFVMAIVLVNFSWFFPRVLLDVANVATATVYGIPSLLETTCEVPADDGNGTVPCKAITDVRFLSQQAQRTALENSGNNWDCSLIFVCYRMEDMTADTISGHSAVLNGLVINHARLKGLAILARPIETEETGDAIMAFIVFLLREMLVLAIHIALFFPLAALTIAFFIRIPVLWLTMAFMPFMFLDKIVGESFGGQSIPTGEIFKKFISAAFLPAITAVPLTVGFILINAGSSVNTNQLTQIPIPILSQINNMWQLLWLFISLAVLYEGVFFALKRDELLSKGADTLQSTGKLLGSMALKAPLNIPFIPAGEGGQSISPMEVGRRVRRTRDNLQFGDLSFSESLRQGFQSRNQQSADLRRQSVTTVQRIEERGLQTSLQSAINRLGSSRGTPDFGNRSDEVIRILNTNNDQLRASRDNLAQVLEHIQTDGRISVPQSVITALRSNPPAPGGGTPPGGTPRP